jgi:hypothetical protein
VLLGALAAGSGLFIENLYRDNAFVQTAWRANDWVTIIVVLPALLISRLFSKRLVKAQLVYTGLVAYLFYNYAFYLFGAYFNNVFLLYVGLVLLSAVIIIQTLVRLPVQRITAASKTVRWICIYLFIIAIMLCVVELLPSLRFMVTGEIPAIVKDSNHPTSIVYALDLTIVVPTSVLAAIWLWKLQSWGVVLAAIMLVKGVTYGLVLCAGTVLLQMRQQHSDALLPFYVFIAIGGMAGLLWLLKHTAIKV